ncbi:hypothetical protein MNBD_ALPHA04-1405 [hydrothermal vent metagenome]|uniref:Uncharacterized protein n=1 Tax=hydrothermal vent metagenome TaxID=652676 RepID=A0A3B0SF43_9ZZZZ
MVKISYLISPVLSLSKDAYQQHAGFDKPSPNGILA